MCSPRLRPVLYLLTVISLLLLSAMPNHAAIAGGAQQPVTGVSSTTNANTAKSDPINKIIANLHQRPPFSQGEKLVYELRLSRFPIYGLIGTLTFTVDKAILPVVVASTAADAVTPAVAEPARPKQGKKKARLAAAQQQAEEDQAVAKAAQENLSRPPGLIGGPLAAPVLTTRLPQSWEGASIPAHLSPFTTAALPPSIFKDYWKVQVRAESKGILTSIFRVDVDDRFISWIDPEDFGVVKTVKQIDEGRRRREMTASFDRQHGKVQWIDQDQDQNRTVQMREEASPSWVTDIAAGWYILRGQPLTPKQVFTLPLSDDAIVYPIEIEVLGEDMVDTDFGSYPTYKVDMKLFDGKYFRRRGSLILWVTKDVRHIPLKAQLKSNYGTVNIAIAEMQVVNP
jgi:hypothetical protein